MVSTKVFCSRPEFSFVSNSVSTFTTSKLQDVHSPRQYKNSSIIRLGAQYHLKEKIFVRAGIYYDFTPVQNGYLTPETPDSDKLTFTAGASYKPSKHFNIDASLAYVIGFTRTDTNIETGFRGTWKSRALLPGIGLEYVF